MTRVSIRIGIRVTWTINVRIGAEITVEREFLDSRLFRAPIFLLSLSLLSFLLSPAIDIQRTEPQFLWLRPSLLRGRYNHPATRGTTRAHRRTAEEDKVMRDGTAGRDDEEEEDEGDEGSGRERHWHGAG